jgi:hypothetical protein
VTVYVDPLFDVGGHYYGEHAARVRTIGEQHGNLWCHLVSDGPDEELHAFAEQIGMERRWAQSQGPTLHYDLTPPRRVLALQHGAAEISEIELGDLIEWKQAAARRAAPPQARAND